MTTARTLPTRNRNWGMTWDHTDPETARQNLITAAAGLPDSALRRGLLARAGALR